MKLSVAICTYNCERFIREQIESILNQDCPVDEIVLGDDGSKDKTVKIAREILEAGKIPYKIILNTTNLGYRKNFEKTISETTGDIIFLSDQDDVWKKEKVSTLKKYFVDNPKCLMAFSNADIVDENLNKQRISLWEAVSLDKDKKKINEWELLFLKGGYVTGAAAVIRRSLFKQALPFSEVCVHDAWLAIVAALQEGIVAVPEKLFLYRQHTANQIGVNYSIKDRLMTKKKILLNLSKKQIEEHQSKSIMFKEIRESFKDFIDKNTGFKVQLDACVMFHEELAQMKQLSKVNRLKTVKKHWMNRDYDRFAKTRGMLIGDILCAIF